jgi:hypothetical protein
MPKWTNGNLVYPGRLPVYLGHVVSDKGVAIDSKNIKVVVKCSIPKDKIEVRSFLGLANYYRCFVNYMGVLHVLKIWKHYF